MPQFGEMSEMFRINFSQEIAAQDERLEVWRDEGGRVLEAAAREAEVDEQREGGVGVRRAAPAARGVQEAQLREGGSVEAARAEEGVAAARAARGAGQAAQQLVVPRGAVEHAVTNLGRRQAHVRGLAAVQAGAGVARAPRLVCAPSTV